MRIKLWLVPLVLCFSLTLPAQDDLAVMVPKIQAALKMVSCPATASAASCASFHKLIDAGNQPLMAQFAPLVFDQDHFRHAVFVVFDHSADSFIVISTAFVHTDNGLALHLASYGRYLRGEMVNGALADGDVPIVNGGTATWSSDKDGVTVSYYEFGDSTLISKESWQGSDGAARTITISVDKTDPADAPQAAATTTFATPTEHFSQSSTALKFYQMRWGQAEQKP